MEVLEQHLLYLSFKNKGEKKGYFSINKNQTSGHRQNNVLKKVGKVRIKIFNPKDGKKGEKKNTKSE